MVEKFIVIPIKEDYEEGDLCPACGEDIVVITTENETGYTALKCQRCGYDATDDEYP